MKRFLPLHVGLVAGCLAGLVIHGLVGFPVSERLCPPPVERIDTPRPYGVTASGAQTRDGSSIAVLREHASRVTSIAFQPGGRLIASASEDQTIRLWDCATWHSIRTLRGHQGLVSSVAFNADGRLLASGSRDGTIAIWDVISGRQLRLLHQGWPVGSVVFQPRRPRLLRADMLLAAFRTAAEHRIEPEILAATDDWRGPNLKIWDVSRGQVLRVLKGHAGALTDVAFSSDGGWLASASHDRTVKVWQVTTGHCLRVLRVSGIPAGIDAPMTSCVAFSPDGRSLAVGGPEVSTIRIWDVRNGRPRRVLTFPPLLAHLSGSSLRTVAFSPNGRFLASGDVDGRVRVWNATTGRALRTMEGHGSWLGGWISAVRFSPDGKRLASASDDGTIRIWPIR